MQALQGGFSNGLSRFVPRMHWLMPASQAKWTTGTPASCNPREVIKEKPAFRLIPVMRVEALKNATGPEGSWALKSFHRGERCSTWRTRRHTLAFRCNPLASFDTFLFILAQRETAPSMSNFKIQPPRINLSRPNTRQPTFMFEHPPGKGSIEGFTSHPPDARKKRNTHRIRLTHHSG
jgi:hypothetical protein